MYVHSDREIKWGSFYANIFSREQPENDCLESSEVLVEVPNLSI